MPEVIGFMKCPVCGELNQEVRVNKNGGLYIFCDHGCSVKFNTTTGRRWKAALAGGRTVSENGVIVTPLNGKKQQILREKTENGTGNAGRIDTIRRTDGQFAGVRATTEQPSRNSWFTDFFTDDE